MKNTMNYFLYQTDNLPSVANDSVEVKFQSISQLSPSTTKFYDVINNENIIADTKNDVFQMQV